MFARIGVIYSRLVTIVTGAVDNRDCIDRDITEARQRQRVQGPSSVITKRRVWEDSDVFSPALKNRRPEEAGQVRKFLAASVALSSRSLDKDNRDADQLSHNPRSIFLFIRPDPLPRR